MLPLRHIATAAGFSLSFLACADAASTSNLSYPDTGWPGDALDESVYLTSSFTTNSGATSYRLDSITINMGVAIDTGGGFKLELRSGTASSPGTVIAQLVGETNPSNGVFTYTPATTILLDGNTTYWVSAGVNDGGGTYRWRAAVNTNQTGDWTIGDRLAWSTDAGASWGFQNYPPSLFSVSATAIPEPSGLVLVSAAGLAMGFRRNRSAC